MKLLLLKLSHNEFVVTFYHRSKALHIDATNFHPYRRNKYIITASPLHHRWAMPLIIIYRCSSLEVLPYLQFIIRLHLFTESKYTLPSVHITDNIKRHVQFVSHNCSAPSVEAKFAFDNRNYFIPFVLFWQTHSLSIHCYLMNIYCTTKNIHLDINFFEIARRKSLALPPVY